MPSKVVGVTPWLPWPFSASPWWTQPVRAERLALLRIGVAACLIADILYHYAPETLAYFGADGLGDPEIFKWRFNAPRANWSLLRGFGDDAIVSCALVIWVSLTLWVVGTALAHLVFLRWNPPPRERSQLALNLWIVALAVYSVGTWAQIMQTHFDAQGALLAEAKADVRFLAWVVPVAGFSLACLFWVLELATCLRDSDHRVPWGKLLAALGVSVVLAILGAVLSLLDHIDKQAVWMRVLRPWQEDKTLLIVAMGLWIGSACLLLIGCATRFAAIMTWVLSISFASVNTYLDNAGDTIRMILLFYLMLCPCGAAWSFDAMWRKRKGPIYVHPWPIRLIFMQMVFIYFMNGLYKLFGASWLEGESLHYVLGDLALTRFSAMMLPLSPMMTRMMTWSVLAWEVTFPFMALWKWTRAFALVCGVLFHLGIFATMELGGFVPYALCMYLPLIPWGERYTSKTPA